MLRRTLKGLVADEAGHAPELLYRGHYHLFRNVGLGEVAVDIGDASVTHKMGSDAVEYSIEIVGTPRLLGIVRCEVVAEDVCAVRGQPTRGRVSDAGASTHAGDD